MNNKRIIIILFLLFLLIVFFSSLQTASKTHLSANAPATSHTTIIYQATVAPTQIPTPTLFPTPTMLPIQHPGFRINGNFGDD